VSAHGQRRRPAVAANDTMPQRRGPVRFKDIVEADIEQGNSKGDQLGDHINLLADQRELDSRSIVGMKMKSRGRRRGHAVGNRGKEKKSRGERRIGERPRCPKLKSELPCKVFWPPGWRFCWKQRLGHTR
jgi:hypothetical protein